MRKCKAAILCLFRSKPPDFPSNIPHILVSDAGAGGQAEAYFWEIA